MKLSIICSTYNAMSFIHNYLKSLNEQLLYDFEVVIVDAQSTDGTQEAIESYPLRDGISLHFIRWHDKLPLYAGWNEAILAAQGDFVVNYNADDRLYPSALSTYLGYLTRYPEVDLWYGPYAIVNKDSFDAVTKIQFCPPHDHNLLKTFCYCGPFPCVRKAAIERVGMFNAKYRSSADYDMWLRLSYHKHILRRIPEIVGCFYYREESVSNKNLAAAQEEDREIQAKY